MTVIKNCIEFEKEVLEKLKYAFSGNDRAKSACIRYLLSKGNKIREIKEFFNSSKSSAKLMEISIEFKEFYFDDKTLRVKY